MTSGSPASTFAGGRALRLEKYEIQEERVAGLSTASLVERGRLVGEGSGLARASALTCSAGVRGGGCASEDAVAGGPSSVDVPAGQYGIHAVHAEFELELETSRGELDSVAMAGGSGSDIWTSWPCSALCCGAGRPHRPQIQDDVGC